MLYLPHVLLFPTLIRKGEVKLKGRSDVTVYRLDWSKIDEKRIKEHLDWKSRYCGPSVPSYTDFPGFMPKKYDKWVLDMHFAISPHYMSEIRRVSQQAIQEWSMERGFDTMIREDCLKPAINYAYVAFMLLGDCLFDISTDYYYRGPEKHYAKQALLYRFWSFQTGRGLIKRNAAFDMLKWIKLHNMHIPEEDKKAALAFIRAIDKYEKEREEAYNIPDLEGPPIADEPSLPVPGPSLPVPGPSLPVVEVKPTRSEGEIKEIGKITPPERGHAKGAPDNPAGPK